MTNLKTVPDGNALSRRSLLGAALAALPAASALPAVAAPQSLDAQIEQRIAELDALMKARVGDQNHWSVFLNGEPGRPSWARAIRVDRKEATILLDIAQVR